MKEGKILVVDDDEGILVAAKVVLKKHFSCVVTMAGQEGLFAATTKEDFDVILLDMNFTMGETSGKEGLSLLSRLYKANQAAQFVMMTAYGEIDLAVEAMKLGAVDFVVKPWENKKLLTTVISAYHLSKSKQKIRNLDGNYPIMNDVMEDSFEGIIGKSPLMKEVFEWVDKVAVTDANVLILGENGTGKELLAKAVHRKSKRFDKVFSAVDLGAVPESLFESELFGHKKGAFTDAIADKKGRFQLAHGGTLFLDEIGNLSLGMQSKLLSAIQNREVVPIGSTASESMDARLVCATNRDLRQMVAERKFREDLLYRINTIEITLPPLRNRFEDIDLLATHFLRMYALKYHKDIHEISVSALDKMRSYSWPGNVRELGHVVERAVIMSEGARIEADCVYLPEEGSVGVLSSLDIRKIEREAILDALRRNGGNVSKASKELGLGRTTFYRKMARYGIK